MTRPAVPGRFLAGGAEFLQKCDTRQLRHLKDGSDEPTLCARLIPSDTHQTESAPKSSFALTFGHTVWAGFRAAEMCSTASASPSGECFA